MKYAAIDAVRMICNLSALSNSFEKKSCMVTSYSTKQLYLVKSKSRGGVGGAAEVISDSAVL